MMSALLRTEARLILRDRVFGALLVILIAATAYGLYSGATWVNFQDTIIANIHANELKTAEERAVRFNDAQHVILPSSPLGLLSTGQTDLAGFYTKISTRPQPHVTPTDELDNPVHLMAGRFDLTFALLVLYPLLIMGLLFNLVSGERDHGTLRLIAAQPTSVTRVIWSKLLVRAVLLFAVPAAIAIGVVVFTGADITRMILWLTIIVCYGACWIAVSLLVNAYGQSSASNASILLAVWLLVIVGIPAAQQMAVSAIHPAPSEVTLVAAIRAARDDVAKRGDQIVQDFYFEHPELAPKEGGGGGSAYQNRIIATDAYLYRQLQPVLSAFNEQSLKRHEAAHRYRLLSPALIAQSALEDVTGTGMERHRSFRDQIQRFQTHWIEMANQATLNGTSTATLTGSDRPLFTFEEESTQTIVKRVLPGLVVMLILSGLFTLIASRRLSSVSKLLT